MPIPRTKLALVVALAAVLTAPSAQAAAADAPLADQIVVRHAPGATAAERADTRADADTTLQGRLRTPDTEVLTVQDGTRAGALAELRRDPDVLWAAPNLPVSAAGVQDPYLGSLYALHNAGGAVGRNLDADVDATEAWGAGYLGAGVRVGVVDSGIGLGQEDLAGRVDTTGAYDFVDNDPTPQDGNGHGTHVAGIIAANLGNGLGVAGIAPQATVVPIRALGDDGRGSLSGVLNAFDRAGDLGLKVVNASLGMTYDAGAAGLMATVMAEHPGTLYVVAAGNNGADNDTARQLPCAVAATNVLCVGATDGMDAKADYSNYGRTTVDLFAPGSQIVSTWVPGVRGVADPYAQLSGTSMATPYVAGAAALVAQRAPWATPVQIAGALKANVDPVPALANVSVSGGRLNAARAVAAPVDAPNRPIQVSAAGGPGQATIAFAGAPDVTGYRVFGSDFALLATTTGGSVTIGGAPAGTHDFSVVASYANGTVSPPALATATITAPAPAAAAPVAPTTGRSGTSPATRPSGVTGVQIVTRRGRRSLVFRVTRTQRVTVTLRRKQGGRYRTAATRTVRMAGGLQSLPITSRLLGMKVPAGTWRVSVGTGSAVATVAFVRR